MTQTSLDLTLQALLSAEQNSPWSQMRIGNVAQLLERVAESFFLYGDALAHETAQRMGVTAGEVWLEVIFPSVWGILSTRQGILKRARPSDQLGSVTTVLPRRLGTFAGRPAVRTLPANWLEAFLLPGFSGYVLLRHGERNLDPPGESRDRTIPNIPPSTKRSLALCLLPFNLASIGALDIVHLLCNRKQRVVAKVSEKVEFVGPHLERIFDPFLKVRALQFVYGGPDVGTWLTARPEFSHIHLTGSARTAAAVARVAGCEKLTSELGGVTMAIVFPDALSHASRLRQVARQVAFGALANNGQHCVSFQIVCVPKSQENAFSEVLWDEMSLATKRQAGQDGSRMLIDAAAAKRLEALVADLVAQGARVKPEIPRADQRSFPTCLIQGINEKMRIFHEEAFGPVLGLFSVPDRNFARETLRLANSSSLAGDLGISLFTSRPTAPETERMAAELCHGVVTINTYPGIAFATSIPWGAGYQGRSGRGWVHNYALLPESEIEKVVVATSLGQKGFGPFRWEDPWLLNVTGERSTRLARALVHVVLGFFRTKRWKLFSGLLPLAVAIMQRDAAARMSDRRR